MDTALYLSPENIISSWKAQSEPPELALARWNKRAESFGGLAIPGEQDSLAMRIMAEKGIFAMGGRALDVGCGAGRFSFALEQRGFQVTGTDFSPKMLEEAEKKKRELGSEAEFIEADWHSAELEQLGWEKSFDFVLCHNSPAICDAQTFLKLSRAATKAVLMLRPCRWVYTIERELLRELGIEPRPVEVDRAMAMAFSLLYLQGRSPETSYEARQMETRAELSQAVSEYTRRIERLRKLSREEKELIERRLREKSVDGELRDSVSTEVIAMFWRLDGINYYG